MELSDLDRQRAHVRSRIESNQLPSTFSVDRILHHLNSLKPLTLPYRDKCRRTVQLWSTSQGMWGAVLGPEGEFCCVPSSRIRVPLNPLAQAREVCERLSSISLRRWDLVFDACTSSITIWPYLEAAGKFQGEEKNRPVIGSISPWRRFASREELEARFKELEQEQRFERLSEDTWKVFNRKYKQEAFTVRIDEGLEGGKHDFPHIDTKWIGEGENEGVYLSKKFRKKHLKNLKTQLEEATTKQEKYNIRKQIATTPASSKRRWQTRLRYAFPKPDKDAPLDRGGGKPPRGRGPNGSQGGKNAKPANRQFSQTLQQTKLVSSYNSSHRGSPMSDKPGTSGDVGGIACSEEYFVGLFDTPESLVEESHSFYYPLKEGEEVPFSDGELKQLIRELTIGIYAHDTLPFFSLHFNQDAELFPVIHPAYQNTLVGRVIGMLDYIMKGYLNGGVFNEMFIDSWNKDPKWEGKEQSAYGELIDFESYCCEHLPEMPYESVDLYLALAGQSDIGSQLFKMLKVDWFLKEKTERELDGMKDILSDYTEFSNSFRILPKQTHVSQAGGLLLMEGVDFDVEYTISPSPRYQEALELYERHYGHPPEAYRLLVGVFKQFQKRIHDHLTQFPLAKKYFSMLHVIQFLSGYLSTLKKHHKVPLLAPVKRDEAAICPPLFPHLPLNTEQRLIMKINWKALYEELKVAKDELFPKAYSAGISSRTLSKEGGELLVELILENIQKTTGEAAAPLFPSKGHFHPDMVGVIQESQKKIMEALASSPGKAFKYGISVSSVEKALDNLARSASSKPSPVTEIPLRRGWISPDADAKKSGVAKRVVGGVGLRMTRQPLLPSKLGHAVLAQHWPQLNTLTPESWHRVEGPYVSDGFEGKEVYQGAIFRLDYESVPPWSGDNYEWLEGLFAEPNPSPDELLRNDTLAALQEEHFEGFTGLLEVYPEQLQVKDATGKSLLHHAANCSDSRFVAYLLERGLSPRERDNLGYLPIHYAAMGEGAGPLKALLAADKTAITAPADNGQTPFMIAVQHGRLDHAKSLRNAGACSVTLPSGYNALHVALHEGHEEVAYFVLHHALSSYGAFDACAEEGGTPLMLACERNLDRSVRELIHYGADSAKMRKDGVTPIEIAIDLEYLELLDYLLTLAIPSNHALERAAKRGTPKVLSALAKHSRFSSYRNPLGETLLHIALHAGNIEGAETIIAKHPSLVGVKSRSEERAVDIAAKGGYWAFLRVLLGHTTFYPPKFENLRLLIRAEYNHSLEPVLQQCQLSLVKIQQLAQEGAEWGNYLALDPLLTSRGADLEQIKGADGWKLPHFLCRWDGIGLLRKLMGSAPDLAQRDHRGRTLVAIAAEHGSLKVLNYFLRACKKMGQSLEKQWEGRHLLFSALYSGREEVVCAVLEHSAEVAVHQPIGEGEIYPIHLAGKMGSRLLLKLFFERKVDVNQEDQRGCTPLYYALRAGSWDAVDYLLNECQARVDAQDIYMAASQKKKVLLAQVIEACGTDGPDTSSSNRKTALLWAVEATNFKAAAKLILVGAGVDRADSRGLTPLLQACRSGALDILRLILTKNPSKSLTYQGMGALQLACQGGHTGCVQLLLKAGFSPKARDAQNKRPYDYANGHRAIRSLLFSSDPQYVKEKSSFIELLEKRDLGPCAKQVTRLPLNEKIVHTHDGQMVAATPLQHLVMVCRKERHEFGAVQFGWLFHPSNSLRESDLYGVISTLQEKGLDVNLPNSRGETLGHLMLKGNLLVERIDGLDLSKHDHRKKSPLHVAARYLEPEVFSRFFESVPKENWGVEDRKGRIPLFETLKEGYTGNAAFLAQRTSGVNHLNFQRYTPLLIACKIQRLDLVRELAEGNADLNQPGTVKGLSPISFAATHASEEIGLFLLFNGAQSNRPDSNHQLPIHAIVGTGKGRMMRVLAAKGSPLQAKLPSGHSTISLATMTGDLELLRLLKSYGIPLDTPCCIGEKVEIRPATLAASVGQERVFEWFMEQKFAFDVSSSRRNIFYAGGKSLVALEALSQTHYIGEVEPLEEATQSAIEDDNPTLLGKLLDKGIHPNAWFANQYSAMHFAGARGAIGCLRLMIVRGGNPLLPATQTEETVLEVAACCPKAESFHLLLQAALFNEGFDVNGENKHGQTLAHLAARAGNTRHLALLALWGADLNKFDHQGDTPLMVAASQGHYDVVSFLVAYGVDREARALFTGKQACDFVRKEDEKTAEFFKTLRQVELKQNPGENPLHLAIRLNQPEAILVLSETLGLEQVDKEGRYPLHLAAELNQEETVLRLLRHGALPRVTDARQRRPSQLTTSKRIQSMLEVNVDVN